MTSQTSSARRLSPQPAPASPPSQPRAKRLTLGAQPSSAQAAVVLRTAADAAGLSEVAFGDAAGVSPTTARAALTEGACPFARVLAVAATCPHFARSLAEQLLGMAEPPSVGGAMEAHLFAVPRDAGTVAGIAAAALADGVIDAREQEALGRALGSLARTVTRAGAAVRSVSR
jgi:hypothetical protein